MMYILTYSLFNTKNIWKLLPGMFIQYIIHHMYHFNNKKDFKTVIIKNIAFFYVHNKVYLDLLLCPVFWTRITTFFRVYRPFYVRA